MSRAGVLGSWAKVLVVDGVTASVKHEWNGDQHQWSSDDAYEITCTFEHSKGSFTLALASDVPFPKEVFDQFGPEFVRKVIRAARASGIEPLAVVIGEVH